MRFFLCLTLLLALVAQPVLADKRQDELKRLQSSLREQQAHDRELAQESAALEKKLETVRGRLVDMTQQLQTHEQAVLRLRTSRLETEKEIAETRTSLEKQRFALVQVLMARRRLDQVPPQVLILRPSVPIDMARSFELLRKTIPEVSEQAEAIKTSFVHLETLQAQLAAQEKDLLEEQAALEKKQAALETTVKERQELLKANKTEQEKSSNRTITLAAQAKDLQDLMARLDREEKARQRSMDALQRPAQPDSVEMRKKPVAAAIARSLSDWFGKVTGKYRLPVTGNVVTGYGEALPGGGHSQGLKIAAAPGAIVTAPADGTVRFAGPFRQYRLLVIVQHGKGEHSLLGGLQELYTAVGARVSAGEPLGKLAKLEGDSRAAASLYYERRRNGKAVDPRH